MAKEYKSVISNEQLEEWLASALTSWPLYRELNYTNLPEFKAVPECLTLHCRMCKKEQIWETDIARPSQYNLGGENNKQGFTQKKYKCRNCGTAWVTYYFYWKTNESGQSTFFKVGQYPELEERVSDTLEKALDADDLGFYRKALRLRNFNLGIAALAYMRRVIENRMNDMLDILHAVGEEHGVAPELLKELKAIKNSRRFTDKVDYGAKLLPANLRPDGLPNPLGVLHELVSDGLHARPEAECIVIFDRCRFVFEYVFGNIRSGQEEAKAFVKHLSGLATPRPTT
jgi:hypothetical protein